MIYVLHHQEWPRKLKEKFDNFVPTTKEEAGSSWSSFTGKDDLASNLKYIQKGLCAYCEIKINDPLIGYHLEHIKPKSKFNNKTFDYPNIILSCFSSDNLNSKDPSISCGHHKLSNFDENLFISPINQNCNDYFDYDLLGKIKPKNGLDANDIAKVTYTIDLLNLNSLRLVRKRNEIIDEGFKIIKELQSDIESLDNFLKLEFEILNNEYIFSFINLRKQYFEELIDS